MADEESGGAVPDVGFDARAAGGEGGVEGDVPPVVVVRVAGDGRNVTAEGCGEVGEGRGGGVRIMPGGDDSLDSVSGDLISEVESVGY